MRVEVEEVAQAVLRLALLGDIADGDRDAADGRLVEQVGADRLDPAMRPVAAQDPKARPDGAVRPLRGVDERLAALRVLVGVDEIEAPPAAQGLRRVPEQPFNGRTGVVQDAVGGHDQHDVRAPFEQGSEQLPPGGGAAGRERPNRR